MRINRHHTVFVADFQLVMEKHRIFPKCRIDRMVNIRKKSALKFFSCNRVEPARLRRLNYYGAEKSVYVCTHFATARVGKVGKQEHSLPVCIPDILNKIFRGGIVIESHICTVGS